MTPVMSYTTTGREGESSSARIINEMEKKTDTISRRALQTSYTNEQLQQSSGGILIQDHRKPREAGAHCSYLLWAIYGC